MRTAPGYYPSTSAALKAVHPLYQRLDVGLAQVTCAIEQLSERRVNLPVEVIDVEPMSAGGWVPFATADQPATAFLGGGL